MKVLFLDTVHPLIQKELENAGFICEQWNQQQSIEEIAADYTGFIVRSKIKITKSVLDASPNLKFIGRVGAGLENIDLEYAEQKGVNVFNSPEGNRDAVGEHALGMLLALLNNMLVADPQVRRGIWKREENRGTEIKGKTVGIIGYGNMGSAFAEKLAGLGCKIIAYDKHKKGFGNDFVKEVGYPEIFSETDILSLHVPLTEETRMLVDENYLSKFEKPVWLINTSRGPVLDTSALLKAIENEKVKGAALDVIEYESFSFENLAFDELPGTFQQLAMNNHVILSPHVAGWTHESKYKLARILTNKILKSMNK
ncbi:MAG: NAD(P)-dependent oxidoreductase [Bacteroidota bacterium]